MKPCIVIPTYENPRTLAAAIAGAREQCPDVIVVDDGSGPETQAILASLEAGPSEVGEGPSPARPSEGGGKPLPYPTGAGSGKPLPYPTGAGSGEPLPYPTGTGGIVVLTHETNRGKGAALQTGLDEALRLGFTHALTMDSDGQHLASEVPKLLDAAREQPTAIVLGKRDLLAAGAGPGSRFGRANSNFWTWVVTGVRVPDTQTGFRVYPLESVCALALGGRTYDFEVEVLVRAAWSGIPLVSIATDVRYDLPPEERVSHLRVHHYLRIAHLNAKLVTQRICLPQPYLKLRSSRRFHQLGFVARWKETLRNLLVEEPGSSGRIGASVGLGLFWGLAPVWGFQIMLCLLTAHALRLSKPVAVLASHVSFPLIVPGILYASLVVGRLVLGLPPGVEYATDFAVAPADVPAWALGSVVLGLGAALVGGLAAFLLVAAARSGRGRAG